MSEEKKGAWGSFMSALKWWFSDDESDRIRFNRVEDVVSFLGVKSLDTVRHKSGKSLIERWFFVTSRIDLMKTNETTKERYDEMISHFNLLVDSLFIIQNIQNEKSESRQKAVDYIEEFSKLLESFEQFLYNAVAQKIDSDRSVRKKIQVSLENE
jgi:hypothetical protein